MSVNRSTRRNACAFGLRLRGKIMIAAAVAALFPAGLAWAVTDNWIGGTGNWSAPADWSAGVPANGSNVSITNADGVGRTITYDDNGSPPDITLLIDLTGGSGSAADTLAMSANSLNAFDPIIGKSGNGAINQSGGTNTIGGYMQLGELAGSTGTYSLSNTGILTNDGGGEFVGAKGTGVFSQTGGTNILSEEGLDVAAFAGSMGTYQLSGASSTLTTTTETTGDSGTGNFTQSGGTNTVTDEFNVGFSAGGIGTFTLSGTGRLLNTGNDIGNADGIEYIGGFANSVGTFIQTGGTNTDNSSPYSSIVLGGVASPSTGTYNLSGGTVTAVNVYLGGFVINPAGTGILKVSGSGVLNVSGTLTAYNTTGTGVNLSGGTLTAATLNLIGGSFTQTGGSATFEQITGTGQMSLSGGTTTLALGGSASQLDTLNISGTGMLDLQLGGSQQGVTYDLLSISGAASLGGTLEVDLVDGFVPSIGEQFILLMAGGGVTGGFTGLTSDTAGFTYTVDYGATNNVVELTVTSVPEPASAGVLALAALGTLGRRRRKLN